MKRCLALLLLSAALFAQEPTLVFQVKFLKILMSSTSQYGVCCPDPGTRAKLESVGINVGSDWKLALASSEAEVKTLKKAGKLVIVTNAAWLGAGAGIGVVDVDGKPQIKLNAANIKASGVTLSDTLIKMANGN